MFVITRQDISPGLQCSQIVHASDQFKYEHPTDHESWFRNSNYLAILSVKNESELLSLVEKVCSHNLVHSTFSEPDLNNELTAIAVAPSKAAKKLFSSLPLALKEFSKKQIGKEVVYE